MRNWGQKVLAWQKEQKKPDCHEHDQVQHYKYLTLFAALVDNDGELSQDVVFERAGMKRSTAYHHLQKLRKLVSQILDEIN